MRIALSSALLCLVAATDAAADAPPVTKEALDAAPAATVESLGVVQTQARICGSMLSPGTKDYPPRLIISFWSMADRKFFRTYVVNLATGDARVVTEPGFDKDAPRWPSVMAQDGKCFMSGMTGGLAVYDPAKDEIKYVRPIERCSWLRGIAVGADGGVYVSGCPNADAARYDPATGQIEYYGRQGGPFMVSGLYGYSVGSDGDWVYTASGKIPWYVVAYSRKTKEQKNLFRFNQEDFPNVVQRGQEVYLSVHIVDQKANTSRNEYYRLAGGEAKPVDALPQRPDLAGAWKDVPQPVIGETSQGLPMSGDGAVLSYKPAGAKADDPWREVKLAGMPGEPYVVQRIAPLGDGRVILATGTYGNVYLFDPATGKYELVGNPVRRNVYCLLGVAGKIYFGGYSNAFLGVFEDGQGKLLYDWNQMIGSKRSRHIVLGADNCIYLGNHAEREFVGGSLGWWDVQAAKPGGIRFPNDECEWLTTAQGGKLIVYSSRAVVDPAHPEVAAADGNIIVFSTEEKKVVQKFSPLPGEERNGAAGMVIEAAPGTVLGFGRLRGQPVMYTAELLTGNVLTRSDLPAPARGDLVRGPDGMIYTFLGETLVRVDPATCAIAPVCKAPPGRMVFVGKDLYLSGTAELRRIKDAAP